MLRYGWIVAGLILIASLNIAILSLNNPLMADVTTFGNVTPVPPSGGGSISGTFTIGNIGLGSVVVNGGTAITSITAIMGDSATGIGGVTLDGFGSNWTILGSTSDLTVGDAGIGSLFVQNNAILTVGDDTFLGVGSNSIGRGLVTGLGSIWDNGDDMTIGGSGVGIFEVSSGGAVITDSLLLGDNASGQGSITITDDLSRWATGALTVGGAGSGRLEVLNGGRLTTTGTFAAGILSTGSAIINVAGSGSLWTSNGSNFTLGNVGVASLTISDGGRVATSSTVTLGSGSDSVSDLIVDGLGSRLAITGALNSSAGEVSITISDGGLITTTQQSTLSPTTRMTLDGGRWFSTQTLSLSGLLQGTGTIDVPSLIVATNIGNLRTSPGDHLLATGLVQNNRQIDLDGGELEIRGVLNNDSKIAARNGATLRVGGTGLDNNNGSQLAITGGSVDVFGPVDNNSGAEIAVVGGATAVFHDAVTNNGTIFVSASSEIVLLENLNFAPVSALQVELSTLADLNDPTDAFGLIDISGVAALDGDLNISLASGFSATLGDTFRILDASSGIVGTFDTETLPELGGGLAFDVLYTSNSVQLAVVASAVSGDFDNDGDVDGRDFLIWQRGGSPNPVSSGDLEAWQSQYGSTLPLGVNANIVPEPNPWLIIGAFSLFSCNWCATRRY